MARRHRFKKLGAPVYRPIARRARFGRILGLSEEYFRRGPFWNGTMPMPPQSMTRKRVSNNEETPQEKEKMRASPENGLSCNQQGDECMATQDTASDSDCFTDAVNVNKLRILTDKKYDPENVLTKLLNPRFGFVERLKRGSYTTELTELLIKVIAVACKSTESDLLTTFLNHINESEFFAHSVVLYVNKFLSGQESINIEVFNIVIEILRRLVTVFPSRALNIVTQLSAPMCYLQKSTYTEISFDELKKELQWAAKHRLLGVPTRDTEEEEFILVNASNYKCMSVTPTCEDIKGSGDPYLRKNKVFSRYTNVDDYLDVQFRLLREDLVRPLRDGLADLLESRKEENRNKRRRGVMKVYQKVQIVSWRCSPDGIVYKLQFDTSRLKRVRWGAGKRLIFGSLVCLSVDQFQTMLVGTIAERNVKDLYKGIVFVNFENDNTQSNSVEFNCYYEMIESPAFYEPYKNVLGVLQHVDDRALPFQRYLLNHGYDEVPPPKYLANKSFMYDFSAAIKRVHKESMEKQNGKRFGEKLSLILDASSWPTAEQLDLDDSQYDALKAALTKEFAVIQGPPGTGKTFIGVLIVQLLLANKYSPLAYFRDEFPSFREPLWDGPILIVCYTNHALDQFLEEIISRHPYKVSEGKIVRFGSRCSSENESLKQCQLFEIMRQSSCRREIGYTKSRLYEIEEHLTRSAAFVELTREELLHEDYLEGVMSPGQFETLTRARRWEPAVLLHWLLDKRGNAWQSDMLREEAENAYIQEDIDYSEGQSGEDVRQSDVGNARPKTDFQDCKTKLRKQAFLNVSQDDLNFQPWKSVRRIHQTFQEEMQFSEADVWNLSQDNRWRLYNYWVSLSRNQKMTERQDFMQEYTDKKRQLDTTLHNEHFHVLARADIVAMTTSAAAKNSKLLKAVKPTIVIVEEAAEVLEAHLVASLSEGCEHLILIGDHKQLRPKPADDRLAKHYWLHVSLFERMVLNRMKCECLAIQHRMRPEISKLLVPHIYRSLTDHGNVKEYEDIAGVMGNLFFLNHSFEENCLDDIQSHSNEHEAAFLAAFCKYLLNVGHSPDKITVLTLYTGQLFLLRKYFSREDIEGVRITAVDNFQGEENDIILLSLVRSNKKNNIGFLSIPNRVCVALSRARKGLYVIGNGDLLRDTSPLWRDILDTLKHDGRLVEKIPLGCRRHPDTVFYVSCAADFSDVPRDGCKHPCEVRLECGHACERNCHVLDPGHKGNKCKKPCQRKPERCRSDHDCIKQCHMECGNCSIPVQRTLDRCQHTVTMQCHEDESCFKCKEPCKRLCPAGHKCRNPCYFEYCVCTELVKRTLIKCQHEVSIPCNENERLIARAKKFRKSSDISDEDSIRRAEVFYYCHEPCKNQCDSGHACKKRCYEVCGELFCTVMTEKILPNCQHKALMPCNLSVDYYYCRSRCEKRCQTDHQCTRLCSEPCGKCEKLVVKTLPVCSHEASIPCYLDPLSHKCRKACEKVCSAGHRCAKECGERCGNCTVQVDKTLPECQHTVKIECHVDPECVVCQMPCEKFLPCGHQCQDICGAAICSQFCAILVDRTLPCKHVVPLPCSEDATNHLCCEQVEVKTCEDEHTKMVDCYKRHDKPAECMTPMKLTCSTKLHDYTVPCHTLKNSSDPIVGCPNTCDVELDCGHRCQRKCEDCVCIGKHSVCLATCDKQFSLCSHKCTGRCGSRCKPCLEPLTAESRCPHNLFDTISICYEVPKRCCEPCKWSCPHYSCEKACWEPCERPPCNRACGKLLRCTHNCVGLCGEPCSSKCRQCDRAEFAKIEKQLGIRFTLKSRFVVLEPCFHLVETTFMDNRVKKFEKHPPCYIDSNSLILKCPICENKVVYCPRYNKVIKGAERLLSEAKRRIRESKTMKKKISDSAEHWLRTNEYSQNIGEDLRGNGNGARLRLGSICILYEIQCQLENFAGSITAKYGPTVDKIGEQVVNGEPTYCKSLISGDIITLFRIYMEIRILRLEKLIRGPKLEVVLRCRGHMKSLPPIEAAATDFLAIWRTIEKVNKSLSMELKGHEGTDDIDDYILHLNKFYDVELNARYMSQWMCCSKGHVYPNEGTLDKDRIDSRCPLCHPIHEYLLKNIRSPSADKKDIVRPKPEKTNPAKGRTTRMIVIKDNNDDQKKIQSSMEQGTDTSIPTITGSKRKNSLRTSSQNDEQMEKMKRGERLESDSSTVPKLEQLVPDASCQMSNQKAVPLLSSEDVIKCRGHQKETERRHTAESSSRKPTGRRPDNGGQVSHETNARLENERTDKRNEKRSRSKDQRRNERDKPHLKHCTSRTSATKKSSHRQTEHHLISEPDSDRSPDCKRRRRENHSANDHFQAEMSDRMKYGHSRHSRDSRETHQRGFHRRKDYDAEYRDRRTPPVQSRARHSQHRQWSHGDSDTSSYGYEHTRDEDYHGHDIVYQREEESVVYEHSQFEAEVADWEEPCHSRDLQYSSGTYYEGTRPEWGEFSGRDADDEYGLQRAPPMRSRGCDSESSRMRHRGNTATSCYEGTSYSRAEPYETNYGEEMSWRSHGNEYTMNGHHDRWSQNAEDHPVRDMQKWNRGVTGSDTDRPPNQRNQQPDLREVIISQRVKLNHLSNEPTSTLNERFSDFDKKSALTSSSSQAFVRPTVSYDEECLGPFTGD